MGVLFLTNYPSPYRVHFFDELGKLTDVTVLFFDRKEEKTHRDAKWFVQSQGNFQMVQLGEKRIRLRGREVCLDVLDWLKKPWDAIVVCGYSAPTTMLAIHWLHAKKIPFYMEVDGGLIRQDSRMKYLFKKSLVSKANFWLSTGRETTRYLVHYGAREEDTLVYPFTSLYEKDLLEAVVSREEKQSLREKLGIREEKVVLSIGQFIHRKGFDVLLEAAEKLDRDTGIYIVGGEATEEYIRMRSRLGLEKNVHFVGFQTKEQLALYYKAADLFVLPTREDIWGLVVNEAMAHGLPVVTTNGCVAGMELVENGISGYVVPVNDAEALAEKMQLVLSGDCAAMGAAALERIRPYTLENMAKTHGMIFENRR